VDAAEDNYDEDVFEEEEEEEEEEDDDEGVEVELEGGADDETAPPRHGDEDEGGEGSADGEAAPVDAHAWLRRRSEQIMCLISALKALLRSAQHPTAAAERSRILAQLLTLRAFDARLGGAAAGAPPDPLPRVARPSSIAELARAWLTLQAPRLFRGLSVELLGSELRAAVALAASELGAAVAAVSILVARCESGGDAAAFVEPLLASVIGHLCRPFAATRGII